MTEVAIAKREPVYVPASLPAPEKSVTVTAAGDRDEAWQTIRLRG
jgi:hypothetical protein